MPQLPLSAVPRILGSFATFFLNGSFVAFGLFFTNSFFLLFHTTITKNKTKKRNGLKDWLNRKRMIPHITIYRRPFSGKTAFHLSLRPPECSSAYPAIKFPRKRRSNKGRLWERTFWKALLCFGNGPNATRRLLSRGSSLKEREFSSVPRGLNERPYGWQKEKMGSDPYTESLTAHGMQYIYTYI